MAHKSSINVLDSLDYTIVDNNSQYLGIENLESIRDYFWINEVGKSNILKCISYLIFYGKLIIK